MDSNAVRKAEFFATARGFLIFALAATLVFAPNFLSQDRTSNFLIYIAVVLALSGFAIFHGAERGVAGPALVRIRSAVSAEGWSGVAVFIAFLALYAVTMYPPSPFNEQVRQAVAFVQGHTYIDAPQSFLEHVQIGKYSYALHPPLPAIMLMPFTAIWGMGTNQTEFSVVV
ncbi:MAG: hypothetical protein WA854_15205, partial [Candidatus Binataceae bacterium]